MVNSEERAERCFVVEDHPILLRALCDLCRDVPAIKECFGYRQADEALLDGPRRRPKLLVCDLGLPGMPIFTAIQRLRNHLPDLKVLVLTGQVSLAHCEEALTAGVHGIMAKGVEPAEFVAAATKILGGGFSSCAAFAPLIAALGRGQATASVKALTRRECEVARYLAQGWSMSQVSSQLGISYKTVDCHRGAIFEKFGISSHRELMRMFQVTAP